jgi:hypothetical protein
MMRRGRLPPHERHQMVRDGLIDRTPIFCDICGQAMEPGELVMCGDGYERVYGEFVLGEQDDLHEDNWPEAHAKCAAAQPPTG